MFPRCLACEYLFADKALARVVTKHHEHLANSVVGEPVAALNFAIRDHIE